MTFTQRILSTNSCLDGHDDCQIIDCIANDPVVDPDTGAILREAGAVVWVSHLHEEIHPEHRLNPCHPAEDHRGSDSILVGATPWCEECLTHPACPVM